MDHPNGLRALAYFDTLFPDDESEVIEARGDAIIDDIKSFKRFGEVTKVLAEGAIPYFVNEFWTSGQRKGHSVHEVSYRACFKPQLPEFFIKRLTAPGEVVLDPFMGRGTTPVEAGLHDRRAFGNDINPLSVLLTRPRLTTQSYHAVQNALMKVDWAAAVDPPPDLLAFYHPETLRRICVLRDHLLRHAPLDDASPDPALDWVRMVAINRLTGHSAGFFLSIRCPPTRLLAWNPSGALTRKEIRFRL